MRPIGLDEIVGLQDYGRLRRSYRDTVIAHKRRRRVAIGEKVTLVFEDRETLRFQIQEMLWVERISERRKVRAELDVYNELMPGEHELSATLFVEIEELAEVRRELDRLVGIDERVRLVLGEIADAESILARFDSKQLEEDRIAAVQYLKFPFSEAQAARFAQPGVPARLLIDHPSYRRQCEIPPEVRQQLIADLTVEPEPLLRRASAAPVDPARPTLFSTDRVRAFGRRERPDHIVVEPLKPLASLLDADPALLTELMEVVQKAAREILRHSSNCRVETELGAGSDRLRWHVYAD
ncbi:MAG: DUF3501 family protein [Myxococcota bacterium]